MGLGFCVSPRNRGDPRPPSLRSRQSACNPTPATARWAWGFVAMERFGRSRLLPRSTDRLEVSGEDPASPAGRRSRPFPWSNTGRGARGHGVPPRPIASAIRPPSLPGLIRRGRRSSAGVLERLEDALAGVRRGGLAGWRNRSCGSAGVAPSVSADLRHSRFEWGNASFSSVKPNRGERIRTFDLLVPNQAL